MKAEGWTRATKDGRREIHVRSGTTSIHVIGTENVSQQTVQAFTSVAGIKSWDVDTVAKGDWAKKERAKKWQKGLTDGQMKFPE